jgi:dTMP kinase
MAAARAQHVREIILPARESGQIVLCDRFVDSTYAYQGGGRRLGFEGLAGIQQFATGGIEPDLKLLLDVPVDIGLRRRHADPSSLNRIDLAEHAFHERVRQAFIQLAHQQPEQWIVVDASASPADVASSIEQAVRSRLDLRSVETGACGRPVAAISRDMAWHVDDATSDRSRDGM